MEYIIMDLQLFGEGGGAGGAAGDGSASAGTASAGTAGGTAQTAASKGSALSAVQYGKQGDDSPETAGVTQGSVEVSPDDRAARFEEMIHGEFKDLYDARMQDTIQRRLRSSKETVDRYNALSPVLEMLGKKYGVDASDTSALAKAIEEDDSYYEDEALERGVTVEQLKQIKKMERELGELRREKQDADMRRKADEDVSRWMAQEKEARAVFPNLSLKEEVQNPQFLSLLKSGVDVQTAYFAVHSRELVPQAMAYTAKTVERNIASGIASGRSRPAENGTQSAASAVVKSDVTQLTKADREEIARRVARGEKIRF